MIKGFKHLLRKGFMKTLGAIFLVLISINAFGEDISEKIDAAQAPFLKFRAQVDVFRNCASAMNDEDQNRIQDRCNEKKSLVAMEILKDLTPDLKKMCPDGAKDYLCGLYFSDRDGLNTSLDTISRILKEQEHAKTGDGIKERACQIQNNINAANGSMKHEKAVGKVSGYVNTARLHAAGTSIVNDQEALESLKQEYKSKSGKSIDLKSCNQ